MRFFNTAGPVRPDKHYAVQPLDRMNVEDLLALIRAKRYFVLHAPGAPPRMANPIYAEVVPRELGYILQSSLDQNPAWYVDDDGGLNMDRLLTAFGTFFGEHSGRWLGRFGEYPEAGPQLILQAYLQRVVNGGGRIEREYGLGRGRTDLLVLWPREAGQPSDLWERFVVECKVLRTSVSNPRWPSRGATRKLHETQAFHCPLKRGNSTLARRLEQWEDRRRTPAGGTPAFERIALEEALERARATREEAEP